jgi:hypothetical protein
MPRLNVNTDAVVKHTATLEKLHKSALPVAIRNTLTKAAFDVKQRTMPKSADQSFIKRAPNFFKANSRVEMAQGWDVNTMKSIVGFVSRKDKGKSVEDLEAQEYGGSIPGRAVVALKTARTGKNWAGRVQVKNRVADNRGTFVSTDGTKGANEHQKFVKSAIHAGVKGLVLEQQPNSRGNKTVYRILAIKRVGRNTVIKTEKIYAVKAGRAVKPEATHFMQRASMESAHKMETIYIQEAEKRIAKYK